VVFQQDWEKVILQKPCALHFQITIIRNQVPRADT